MLFIVISSTFLFVFDFLNGFHFLLTGNQTSSYFLMIFWPILPVLVLIIYFKNKFGHFGRNWTLPIVAKQKLSKLKERRFLFWSGSLIIMFVPITLSILTWGERLSAMRNPFLPWFVYIICLGFPLVISIAGLPLLFRTTEKKSTLFIFCWLLSLILLGLSGPYLLVKIFPSLTEGGVIFNRFLQQIVYLTSSLAALVLSVYWSKPKNNDETGNLKTKSTLSGKFTILKKMVPLLFIVIIAFSFLYMPYGTEYYLKAGNTSNHSPQVDAEVFNWVNANISRNSVILPLSDQSYTQLCALTQSKVMSPKVVINLLDEQNSSDQASMCNALHSLNISYVYEPPMKNFTSLGFNNQEAVLFVSVLSTFRVIYQNNNYTIYAVTY